MLEVSIRPITAAALFFLLLVFTNLSGSLKAEPISRPVAKVPTKAEVAKTPTKSEAAKVPAKAKVAKDGIRPNVQERIIAPRVYRRSQVTTKITSRSMPASERVKLKPKYKTTKPAKTKMREGLKTNRVIVKFVDGANIRDKNEKLDASKTDSATVYKRLDLLKLNIPALDDYDRELLNRKNISEKMLSRQMAKFRKILKKHKIKNWNKLFNISDSVLSQFRLNAEVVRKRQSSDLANYYAIHLKDAGKGELLADALNKLDIVEIAYLAPVPEDPDIPPATPNYQGLQTYLNAAPGGIDARYAWTIPGGKGDLIKIIDVEAGWNLGHEDLPSVFINDGRHDNDDSRQHGTAVLGVMLGLDDGVGVTGIVPNASGGVVSVLRGLGWAYYDNVAEAILIAAMNLSEGDVLLVEQHSRGPGKDKDCNLCDTDDGEARDDCGYIAMEYWNDIFDAINAATAAGVIVVEAAGNGEMDLDHDRYKDRFNRVVRDSGAIMVGGGTSGTHEPKCWSNYGSRLDLQGWGESVMTTGYGSPDTYRINGNDENQWYRRSFGGTSSATPIVAGAVAAVQGVQLENNNPVLDWYEMGELLKSTGTPQSGTRAIGPLPDLKKAIVQLVGEQPPSPEDAVYEYSVTLGDSLLDADRTVSGFSGGRTRTLGLAGDLSAIERLKFGERGDRGCYVRVEKAHIVDNTIEKPHDSLDICGNRGPTDRSLKYVPLLTTSHDTFIRGVSVCNSRTNNNTRLKGVKVYRSRVDEDGSLARISNPTTFERPNCDGNWRTPVNCPNGSLATKLVVHIREDGNDEVITGLGLKCKAVEVVRSCVSGC